MYYAFPNTFRSSNWKIEFSNVPVIDNIKDLKYFNNYTKTLTLPDYNIKELFQYYMGYSHRNPGGGISVNDGLQPIIIEYKLSEDFLNYYFFWLWINKLRYGNLPENQKLYKQWCTDVLHVFMLDNQQREMIEFKFKDVFCLNISQLNLPQGVNEEVSFMATFYYNEVECELLNPLLGGITISPPTVLDPCGLSGRPIDLNVTWS